MEGLKHLYRIGNGPSSSHTIAPMNATRHLLKKYPNTVKAEVTLFGSLALTGKGHFTDLSIKKAFGDIPCEVFFDYKNLDKPHINTFDFKFFLDNGEIAEEEAYSVGGGEYEIKSEPKKMIPEVYKEKNLKEIIEVCKKNNWRLYEYVYHHEPNIKEYLIEVWHVMQAAIERGMHTKGKLPGKLGVDRKAPSFIESNHPNESLSTKSYRLISCYAFAVSEENASGGLVVTAPTCGSAGTLPSMLKYMADTYHDDDDYVANALATAGIVGNCIKHNGSISGAEAGCQAEIGSACAMAAAALAELRKYNLDQIDCAAEIALEHNLGLTCDPIDGYVQIPCIERNAVAASKAIMSCYIAEFSYKSSSISFDEIVEVMLQTGKDLDQRYRETSLAGLATTHIKYGE